MTAPAETPLTRGAAQAAVSARRPLPAFRVHALDEQPQRQGCLADEDRQHDHEKHLPGKRRCQDQREAVHQIAHTRDLDEHPEHLRQERGPNDQEPVDEERRTDDQERERVAVRMGPNRECRQDGALVGREGRRERGIGER